MRYATPDIEISAGEQQRATELLAHAATVDQEFGYAYAFLVKQMRKNRDPDKLRTEP